MKWKVVLFCLTTTFIMGCSDGVDGKDGSPGVPGTSAPLPPALTDVEELVAMENEYRTFVGQAPLTQGLTCTLYNVTNPGVASSIATATLSSVATFTMTGTFNQPDAPASTGLNLLPTGLRMVYLSWFVVRCTGKIVVTTTNYYQFDLLSDDGSLLYVGGGLLINNDGNHGAVLKSGSKLLRAGIHDIRLDYMQGPSGNQALILGSGGVVVPAAVMYH